MLLSSQHFLIQQKKMARARVCVTRPPAAAQRRPKSHLLRVTFAKAARLPHSPFFRITFGPPPLVFTVTILFSASSSAASQLKGQLPNQWLSQKSDTGKNVFRYLVLKYICMFVVQFCNMHFMTHTYLSTFRAGSGHFFLVRLGLGLALFAFGLIRSAEFDQIWPILTDSIAKNAFSFVWAGSGYTKSGPGEVRQLKNNSPQAITNITKIS